MRHAAWPLAVAILVSVCPAALAAPPSRPAATLPAATLPAASTSPTSVPAAVLKRLDSLVKPPDPSMTREKALAQLQVGLLAVLQLGEEAEANYPAAADLHEVRSRMLQAAYMLHRLTEQGMYEKEAVKISRRILGADAPPELKVQADSLVTRAKIRDGRLKDKEIADEIRQFAARYADSNAAFEALIGAAFLARQAEQENLTGELADRLQAKHADRPEVKDILRQLDRHPDVGQPFEAELTRLDGTKLSLPKDLLGKVVVIDFWATWCGPCVAEVPHMKEVYAQYAAKGVEFVGISLDRDKDAPARFAKENEVKWIQTYDVRSPAAEKYGIEAIPSVWVVGKDGKVFSDNARGDLEKTLDKALAAPASAPAKAK